MADTAPRCMLYDKPVEAVKIPRCMVCGHSVETGVIMCRACEEKIRAQAIHRRAKEVKNSRTATRRYGQKPPREPCVSKPECE